MNEKTSEQSGTDAERNSIENSHHPILGYHMPSLGFKMTTWIYISPAVTLYTF